METDVDVIKYTHNYQTAERRPLLHEIGRIAEQALVRARKVKEEGEPAIARELHRLSEFQVQLATLRQSPDLDISLA